MKILVLIIYLDDSVAGYLGGYIYRLFMYKIN